MRVLLVSTYELGQQPAALAAWGAALGAAGHQVRAVDLSLGDVPDPDAGSWADALVVSVPMHTALRLAFEFLERARADRPEVPVALCGLYAPVAEGHRLLGPGDLLAAGEPVGALLEWLGGVPSPAASPGAAVVDLGPVRLGRGPVPDRSLLPPLERYARLIAGPAGGTRSAGSRVAGATATTVGCNHRCRHCPVASIYGGRSRVVDPGAVLADVEQLVAAGAGHVTFADPDFLNRPRHGLEVARGLHARFPDVSFDATVKVEHVLRHRALWPELADLGLLFVTSAFESCDDQVLALLDKGHTAADEGEALAVLRSSHIETRPSWLPFTPWTTSASLAELLRFTAEQDLVWSTDLVQFSIRLLLPKGSLLLEGPDPVLAAALDGFDQEVGSWRWHHAEAGIDELQQAFGALAAEAESAAWDADAAFGRLWALARSAGVALPAEVPEPVRRAPRPGPERPRLSESWFCCAEPTAAQLVAVGSGRAAAGAGRAACP